ncbi:MAG: putative dehydrogenase [Phycisphaerales bacterium]
MPTTDTSLRIGVIGLGFMGKTHLEAYAAAIAEGANAQLVAVADADADRRAGIPTGAGNIGETTGERMFDPARVTAYETAAELLADERVQLVSLCTPTDTHIDLATRALRAGKHVLLEKPVALTHEAVEELQRVAESAGCVCIPAMCMRFWPAWAWLKGAIDAQKYGSVVAARFERLGSRPTWGQGFYNDAARSGGALFDLHVHDTDFVVHCFGEPVSVSSLGSRSHVQTVYEFAEGPGFVQAEGGWLNSPHFPYRMRYTVEFENAVADFDLTRDDPLRVHTADGTDLPELEPITGYDGEIRLAIQAATAGAQPSPSLRDAAIVTRVLQAEAQSLETGGPVVLRDFNPA